MCVSRHRGRGSLLAMSMSHVVGVVLPLDLRLDRTPFSLRPHYGSSCRPVDPSWALSAALRTSWAVANAPQHR